MGYHWTILVSLALHISGAGAGAGTATRHLIEPLLLCQHLVGVGMLFVVDRPTVLLQTRYQAAMLLDVFLLDLGANAYVDHRVQKRQISGTIRNLIEVVARDDLHQTLCPDYALRVGIESRLNADNGNQQQGLDVPFTTGRLGRFENRRQGLSGHPVAACNVFERSTHRRR